MKLRLLPVVLSVVLSSAVLFGGWFAYNSFAMENPLSHIVQQTAGVETSHMKLSSGLVEIDLSLEPDADLRQIVHHIRTEGTSIIGAREIRFHVTNPSSPELDAWWSKALFDIAQAMETKHYGEIPATLERYAAQLDGLDVASDMDEDYVYIRLTDGAASKFVMLPRTSSKLGVWPNE